MHLASRVLIATIVWTAGAKAQDTGPVPDGWHTWMAGRAFIYGTAQSGLRGRSQIGAVDEGEALLGRRIGATDASLHLDANNDALTSTPQGYPQLLQSGEIYHQQGVPDRGHPEHVITDLGLTVTHAFAPEWRLSAALGVVGRPVAGPVPADERASAAGFPFAPIGEHAENLPDVAFGVGTVTVTTARISLATSIFNGHEPSDNYTSFQFRGRHLDSFAARVQIALPSEWQLGLSWADIANAEPVIIARAPSADRSAPITLVPAASENVDRRPIWPSRHLIVVAGPSGPPVIPSTSLHRVVVAAYRTVRRDSSRTWASTVLLSEQRPVYQRQYRPAALAETNMDLTPVSTFVARAEFVRKNDADLGYTTPLSAHSIYNAIGVVPTIGNEYNVTAISVGMLHAVGHTRSAVWLGALGTVDRLPATLRMPYGTRTPVGATVFVRLTGRAARGQAP